MNNKVANLELQNRYLNAIVAAYQNIDKITNAVVALDRRVGAMQKQLAELTVEIGKLKAKPNKKVELPDNIEVDKKDSK
jgi:hypothetical protein